ncbi:hypothetical protein EVAR_3357_1 [Eumeta japonica]|uniref:Uncharacterized protein n=1 Tax=Eumeta variegata TaxID=151549 RepID=A0A4C1SS97_EUMVA|nr:hypothetical protein EVAR_3357_1 [Eumeta japonica]
MDRAQRLVFVFADRLTVKRRLTNLGRRKNTSERFVSIEVRSFASDKPTLIIDGATCMGSPVRTELIFKYRHTESKNEIEIILDTVSSVGVKDVVRAGEAAGKS